MIPLTTDGDYSQRSLLGPTKITRPFLNWPSKDSATKIFDRIYEIDRGSYTPFAALATLPAETTADPADAAAYLLEEGEPDLQPDGTQAVRCIFGHIPGNQVRSATREITKPTAAAAGGISVGNLTDYTASDSGAAAGAAYSYGGCLFVANKVYSRRAITPSRTAPTGGTYTVTYKTSTTAALAYNETAANIAAAINALADVITDGLTVSLVNGLDATGRMQLNVTVGATASRFTVNGASLTPAASKTAFTQLVSATQQQLSVAVRAAVTAHGFSTALPLIVNTSASDNVQTLLPHGTHWSVVDANTLAYDGELGGTAGSFLGQALRSYTPGLAPVVLRITLKFYLPGVAPTATLADIPAPSSLLNDAAFLDAVIANLTGYVAYTVGERSIWRGPIYQQETVEIDFATV